MPRHSSPPIEMTMPGNVLLYFLKISTLLTACLSISGCLLNSVRPIKHALPEKPDSNHSIVVIGVGLDAPWPYKEFSATLDEYSLKQQNMTGNCFIYNRINVTRSSTPAPVSYYVFEVPASAYVYGGGNIHARLPASPNASGFIAPPGKTVYFADYVFVGNEAVEQRRDLEAAREATKRLLPHGAALVLAEAVTPPHGHMFLCTP